LVGLQFAFQTMNYAGEVDSNVAAFRDQTGGYPALVGAYFDLSSRSAHLKAFLDAAHANGCIPYVTLDPKDWDEPDIKYQKTFTGLINAGKFDSALAGLASALRDFGHPVLLRYAHEMNGDWYPYAGGGDADGDGEADGPETFIRAWRHVHDLFTANGAGNLLWVFCPNAEDFPSADWNRPFRYFPGREYADLIFLDAYEHFTKKPQRLDETTAHFYGELGGFLRKQRSAGDSLPLPFGLGEFGTNRTDKSAKAAWYAEALDSLAADERIKFHVLYNGQNGGDDFSLRGLGDLIVSAYKKLRFQFRLFAPA
jgi:hypothetical protein